MNLGADFSQNRLYRYRLWRIWNSRLPYLNVIGLNPSTADESEDDPTIRRCMGFAARWGFGGLYMTNLFAFRATKPADMMTARDPIGVENDAVIEITAIGAGRIIAAWGKHGTHRNRAATVEGLIRPFDVRCFKRNQDGTPTHPLYQPNITEPVAYFDSTLVSAPRPGAKHDSETEE